MRRGHFLMSGRSILVERQRLLQAILVVLLLGGFALSALYSIVNKSPTSDEGIHLMGGYSFWRLDDYRLHPENGMLPQRLAALPVLAAKPQLFDLDGPAFLQGDGWGVEAAFFYGIGNEPIWLFFLGRAMIVLAAILIGLMVFCYARSLWGFGGGALALTLYCFCPDVLAHGRLVTSDLMGAGLLLGSVWAVSRMLREVTIVSVALCGVVFGLMAVAKFSAVLMIPITGLLLLLHLSFDRKTTLHIHRELSLDRFAARLGAMLGALAVVGLIAWIILWAFYGFRYEAANDNWPEATFLHTWDVVRPSSDLIAGGIDIAREYQLLPESYLYGFSFVVRLSEWRHAFLAGQYSNTGWWYFFPFTFLVKSPVAFLALLLLGFAILLRPAGKHQRVVGTLPRWAPLVVLIVVYGAVAMSSSLNIGHRHILPIYLALFVLLGSLWRACQRHGQAASALLLVIIGVYLAESLSTYPHYLTFFNQLAGGPERGRELLVDSSLDWGQDLYLLDDWLDDHNAGPDREPVTLSYFGRGSVEYIGLDVRYWRSRGLFLDERFHILPLSPGLFVTSASTLQGLFAPVHSPWTQRHESSYVFLLDEMERLIAASTDLESALELIEREGAANWNNQIFHFINYRASRMRLYLKQKEPIAELGNTLFIYRLSPEDTREMVIRPELGFPEDFPVQELLSRTRELAQRQQSDTQNH